jgi:GT2 family glycosyltransferase
VPSPNRQSLPVSVIVPVFNGARTLGRCLEALANQTIDARNYQVIVVDDGSSDGSGDIAARHGATVLRHKNAGAATARNRGARKARGEILLFTDADCEPQRDWIEQMLAPFARADVAGVKGAYRTWQRSLVARFAQAEYEEKYDRQARMEWIDFVDTYAAAYRRDIFLEHGGFDPSFGLDEDQEFSFRLARAGQRLVFAPQAIVYHQHPASMGAYARRKLRLGFWKVRVHARHPTKALRDSYTPWTQKAQLALLPLIVAGILTAIVDLVPWLVPALLALLGLVSTFPLLAKARQQGWQVALVAPALAVVRAAALLLGIAWGLASAIFPANARPGKWLALAVTALALTVYILTLASGPTFENYGTDSGDLIAAARTLGVPHPSGYPTYTLLAWLFSHLPLGTIAYRVNLLSAVCAALAAGLLCLTTQLLLPKEKVSPLLSAAAALTLAFSPLYWSQAVISEVYALLALLASVLLWLLVRWRHGGSDWSLVMAGLVLGLGLGNHLTLGFIAPAALIFLWPERRRWFQAKVLLPTAALFLAGLAVYAYLPLAAIRRPPVNWGNPQTWDGFLWVVTGEQYQPFVFGLATEGVPARLGAWSLLLGKQFGWWGLALALAGAWSWWQRDRQFIHFCLAWIVPLGLYAFFYNTGDSHIYLIPALMLLALWWGDGARYLLHFTQRLRPIWQRLILALIILLPFVSLTLHWQATDLSDDWYAYAYGHQALDAMAPGGLVIVRGDQPTFALWYAVYAEGNRPDVAIISGPMMAFIWYREHLRHLYPYLTIPKPTADTRIFDDLVHDLIDQNLASRPIYATDPKEEWEDWFDFVKIEDAPLYRVQPKPGLE